MVFILTGIILGLIGLWLLFISRRPPDATHQYHGPHAKVLRRQLISWEYGITGKPSYIIEHNGQPIPILVKRGKAPQKSPHDSHIAQILTYCLLIHENTQMPPPYGIIRYRDRTFEVDYNEVVVEALLDLIEEIHQQRNQPLPSRSHEKKQHCAGCRYRKRCEESLV
ncbi:MAG: CRISPR-associated protein Cas4 [Phototrophicales bacterium]|nr:MAG: CRISPR-associated protein Cas4 [Phototrophicales bacterium]